MYFLFIFTTKKEYLQVDEIVYSSNGSGKIQVLPS